MTTKSFTVLTDVILTSVTASVFGLVSGFVVSLLMYGVNLLADSVFDFYAVDLYFTPPLVIGMMLGALWGAILGGLVALKKLKA